MSTFKQRRRQHDEKAMPIVEEEFSKFGFDKFDDGVETQSDEKRIALSQQKDITSLMHRYRPDAIMIKRGEMSILCEVKSEADGKPNFAIEVDSYTVAHALQGTGQSVMYAFVDLSVKPPVVLCCWVDNVPSPTFILMPNRWDYGDNLARMQEQYPGARIKPLFGAAGSGTPFFLIPKKFAALLPFSEFAVKKLGLKTAVKADNSICYLERCQKHYAALLIENLDNKNETFSILLCRRLRLDNLTEMVKVNTGNGSVLLECWRGTRQPVPDWF